MAEYDEKDLEDPIYDDNFILYHTRPKKDDPDDKDENYYYKENKPSFYEQVSSRKYLNRTQRMNAAKEGNYNNPHTRPEYVVVNQELERIQKEQRERNLKEVAELLKQKNAIGKQVVVNPDRQKPNEIIQKKPQVLEPISFKEIHSLRLDKIDEHTCWSKCPGLRTRSTQLDSCITDTMRVFGYLQNKMVIYKHNLLNQPNENDSNEEETEEEEEGGGEKKGKNKFKHTLKPKTATTIKKKSILIPENITVHTLETGLEEIGCKKYKESWSNDNSAYALYYNVNDDYYIALTFSNAFNSFHQQKKLKKEGYYYESNNLPPSLIGTSEKTIWQGFIFLTKFHIEELFPINNEKSIIPHGI